MTDLSNPKADGQTPVDIWTQPPINTFQFPHVDFPEQKHTEAVYSIHLVGNYLISGSRDKSIRIWNVATQQLVRALDNAHEGSVLRVWYHEDTDTIVSGATSGDIIIWRFSTGEVIKKIEKAHEESVLNLMSDGLHIASVGKDRTVKLWDCKDYSLKWTALGHTAAV